MAIGTTWSTWIPSQRTIWSTLRRFGLLEGATRNPESSPLWLDSGESVNRGHFVVGRSFHPSKDDVHFWKQLKVCLNRSIPQCSWVLTAAHCVFGKSPRSLEMMLGDNDVKKKDSGERRVAACKIVNHPYYSSTRTAHDIALIKLCKQARISPVIDVIGLSGAHTDLSNVSNVTVAGWGKTQEDGRVSRKGMPTSHIWVNVWNYSKSWNWSNMLRSAKQIHKYSRQTREKSEWKTRGAQPSSRVFHEDFSRVWSEYYVFRWAELSILPLFLVFWSPQPLNIHP